MTLPVIFGCLGTSLSDDEKTFFKKTQPLGFILFQRNCESPDQVKALTDSMCALVNHDNVAVLIDQEGGRVARLKPPHWREYPTMETFGKLAMVCSQDAATALRLNCRLIADDLRKIGVTVDCLPVLDLPQSEANPIIGDRAFSDNPHLVGALGRIAADALAEGGVLPVIKHIPGHGRASVDSHKELPIVDADYESLAAHDFVPFRALSDAPFAMTAHVKYLTLDTQHCATQSATVIQDVIRDKIGFKGYLISDDLSMEALEGGFRKRTKLTMDAGCDIALHCNGNMDEMIDIASVLEEADSYMVEDISELLLLASRQPMIDRAEDVAALDAILRSGL